MRRTGNVVSVSEANRSKDPDFETVQAISQERQLRHRSFSNTNFSTLLLNFLYSLSVLCQPEGLEINNDDLLTGHSLLSKRNP